MLAMKEESTMTTVKRFPQLLQSLKDLDHRLNKRIRGDRSRWLILGLPLGELGKKVTIMTMSEDNKAHLEELMRELRPDAIPHTRIMVVSNELTGKNQYKDRGEG